MSQCTRVVVVSDLHCGSTMGLFPREGWTNDDGNHTSANRVQEWLWACWTDFCGRVSRTDADRLYVVLNGDLTDGNHHGTHQLVNPLEGEHAKVAMRCLEPLLRHGHDAAFVVKGTEVHVGKGGSLENGIARAIGAEPCPDTGSASWYHLRLLAGGVRLDVRHHGRGYSQPWLKGAAANRLAAQILMEYADAPDQRPHLAIRSHTHKPADSYDNYPTRVIQTWPWQLSTAYGYRIDPGTSPLTVGALIVDCYDEPGRYVVHKHAYTPQRTTEWRAAG